MRQPLGKHAWLEVVAYLKDARKLITIRRIKDAGNWDYSYYTNANDARMKGLELSLGLDNGGGLRARLAYALSEVRGTGSYPGSSIGYVDDYPARLPPAELYLLDHNQTHRGTILLSARPSASAGSILDGLALNLLMTFNSGHNFGALRTRSERELYDPLLDPVTDILDPRDATLAAIPHSFTTPAVFNVDVSVGKTFTVGGAEIECYMLVTNLLNAKQTVNVYPTTGSATDDGAFGIQGAERYLTNPEFLTMRRMLNIENRWSYAVANAPWYNRETLSSGLPDIYGMPRQIRVGIRVGINGG
ncbi:MAG: TonB-dependent receptor [Bacteroidetes bacterium]|nr:TonB-dependent receptor [Bacteroidota bacterium]